MTDPFDHGLIGTPVAPHVAGQDVKIIDQILNKWCISSRTKTVTMQKMRLYAITTPVEVVNTSTGVF